MACILIKTAVPECHRRLTRGLVAPAVRHRRRLPIIGRFLICRQNPGELSLTLRVENTPNVFIVIYDIIS